MCLVPRYLVLDFLPNISVRLEFCLSLFFEVIDFFGYFTHACLEVNSQARTGYSFSVQHVLVFQVEIMIFLEDGFAHKFQSIPDFRRLL